MWWKAKPGRFGMGRWGASDVDWRYHFYFRRSKKGFSIGNLHIWTNVSNKPEKLSRGLYEFTRQYGMTAFAWVNSKGEAFSLESSIPVEEFHAAWERGAVWRLGRLELWMNQIGYEPTHELIEDPWNSYRSRLGND